MRISGWSFVDLQFFPVCPWAVGLVWSLVPFPYTTRSFGKVRVSRSIAWTPNTRNISNVKRGLHCKFENIWTSKKSSKSKLWKCKLEWRLKLWWSTARSHSMGSCFHPSRQVSRPCVVSTAKSSWCYRSNSLPNQSVPCKIPSCHVTLTSRVSPQL